MQFRARFVANIIQFAAQQGASPQALYEVSGLPFTQLQEEDRFVDAGTYNAVTEQAMALSGDELFGLHLGEYLSLSAAGLIVQIVQSSQTVGQALHYIVEFANLGCQAMPFQLVERADDWELSLHPNPAWEEMSPIAVRQTMDGTIVFTLREFYTLTRQRHAPLRIHFAYDRPDQLAEYERLFSCPLRFQQPLTAIYLDKRHVAEPIITGDFQLLQVLVQYAERKLNGLQQQIGFSSRVKETIINLVKPQFPTIEQVAANLNVSVRTLQRRLKQESRTYKELLDELRHQFALDYLNNAHLSIKEIAYLLDYADASSFIRSFNRWEGQSPEAFRERFR